LEHHRQQVALNCRATRHSPGERTDVRQCALRIAESDRREPRDGLFAAQCEALIGQSGNRREEGTIEQPLVQAPDLVLRAVPLLGQVDGTGGDAARAGSLGIRCVRRS
jgi:hypothetical protein